MFHLASSLQFNLKNNHIFHTVCILQKWVFKQNSLIIGYLGFFSLEASERIVQEHNFEYNS